LQREPFLNLRGKSSREKHDLSIIRGVDSEKLPDWESDERSCLEKLNWFALNKQLPGLA
jgi:hypothetical protein